MPKIIIEAVSPHNAEQACICLLKGGFIAKRAWVSYNLAKGLCPLEDTNSYPLILEGYLGTSFTSICVYAVSAGYNAAGPSATVAILNAAGFVFNKDDILTTRCRNSEGYINLSYKH